MMYQAGVESDTLRLFSAGTKQHHFRMLTLCSTHVNAYFLVYFSLLFISLIEQQHNYQLFTIFGLCFDPIKIMLKFESIYTMFNDRLESVVEFCVKFKFPF